MIVAETKFTSSSTCKCKIQVRVDAKADRKPAEPLNLFASEAVLASQDTTANKKGSIKTVCDREMNT